MQLKRLGKYEIVRKLGIGGMGTVYLANDTELKRPVALKVLAKDRADNATLVRRFKSEGHAAALLQHRNIVSVYEAGQIDGFLFLALEYIEGVDLLEWMHRKGAIPVKRSIEIVRQVATALQHAYERNIVHRDIKPSNLLISRDGAVKLTDMGLARSVDDTLDTTITRDGTTVGTVDYMAPEQASNSKSADIRSDIYSLGCTWFHMLTGSPPYPNGSVTNKLAAHISAPLPDPRTLNRQVPDAVVAILHRMIAKTKEHRYQTPAELLADLNSPSFIQTGDAVNLLEMFGESELLPQADNKSRAATEIANDSAGFVMNDPSHPATKVNLARGRKGGRRSKAKTVETKVEIPTAQLLQAGKSRTPLIRTSRLERGLNPETDSVVPWRFLLLIVLLLVLAFIAWHLIENWTHSTLAR